MGLLLLSLLTSAVAAVWLCGITFISLSVVALRRARLLLGWVPNDVTSYHYAKLR